MEPVKGVEIEIIREELVRQAVMVVEGEGAQRVFI